MDLDTLANPADIVGCYRAERHENATEVPAVETGA